MFGLSKGLSQARTCATESAAHTLQTASYFSEGELSRRARGIWVIVPRISLLETGGIDRGLGMGLNRSMEGGGGWVPGRDGPHGRICTIFSAEEGGGGGTRRSQDSRFAPFLVRSRGGVGGTLGPGTTKLPDFSES